MLTFLIPLISRSNNCATLLKRESVFNPRELKYGKPLVLLTLHDRVIMHSNTVEKSSFKGKGALLLLFAVVARALRNNVPRTDKMM